MKAQTDDHITNHEYQVDDQVLLKHKPYAQTLMMIKSILQIDFEFVDPFKILECIGAAAFKLELPEGSQCNTLFVWAGLTYNP